MRLDFQITHLLHPHLEKGHGCVYDHINWAVWISDQELLDDINETFDYNLKLEKNNEVREEVAHAIWQYISKQEKWIGTYGTDYDVNMIDIIYEN